MPNNAFALFADVLAKGDNMPNNAFALFPNVLAKGENLNSKALLCYLRTTQYNILGFTTFPSKSKKSASSHLCGYSNERSSNIVL